MYSCRLQSVSSFLSSIDLTSVRTMPTNDICVKVTFLRDVLKCQPQRLFKGGMYSNVSHSFYSRVACTQMLATAFIQGRHLSQSEPSNLRAAFNRNNMVQENVPSIVISFSCIYIYIYIHVHTRVTMLFVDNNMGSGFKTAHRCGRYVSKLSNIWSQMSDKCSGHQRRYLP